MAHPRRTLLKKRRRRASVFAAHAEPIGDVAVPRTLSADVEKWVRSAMRQMTLEEKLGQLVMIPFFGEFASAESPEFKELARAVERLHVGGLIVHTRRGALGLERSRAYPTAELIQEMQRRSKIPLLVAADFERGTAMRLEEGTSFPHAMAVAATGRAEDAYAMGRITALEARALGVTWIFAPVADVNSDPENPIINVRSFGEDPARVAKLVAEYVRGVEENGAFATAKHFPGHGNTKVDSHMDLPTVESDPTHLERIELRPFRAAIAVGVSTVMTGHIAVPALEPEPGLPTTFSSKITQDLLRRAMGFGGLIVTDDLSMGGVSLRYTTAEAAVRSMLSGSDVLLAFADVDAALAGLREAVESLRLPIARIDDAVLRILRAKARLGLRQGMRVVGANIAALPKEIARPEFADAALDIADRGVTLLRDQFGVLPLEAARPLRVQLVVLSGDPDPSPGAAFEQELRWRVDSLDVQRADTRFHTVESLDMSVLTAGSNGDEKAAQDDNSHGQGTRNDGRDQAHGGSRRNENANVVVLALFVRVADRKGSVGLPDEQLAVAQRVLASSEKPVIVACFGSPYVIAKFPEARVWLAAFSTAEVAQRATARALFGQVAIGGRIPVNVPGAVALGAGLDVAAAPMRLVEDKTLTINLQPASRWLEGAVRRREFPGGVLAVGLENRLAVHAFGKLGYDPRTAAVKVDTIFDTASLTKPLVTATLAAMLSERGQLDVDAPVARYIPEWAGGAEWTAGPLPEWRASVTIRNLLTHTSGLPAHRKYFETLIGRRQIVAAAIAEPLECEPGTRSVYSDVGFIILGEVIERLTGRRIDQVAAERIFGPLGMNDTFFCPNQPALARLAPVIDESPRRFPLRRGIVHDQNAEAMGGIAGHAGIFSTAGDLAIFCQMLLNGGIYGHTRLLRRQTVVRFTAASPLSGNARTLGWMVPTAGSSSGSFFSPRSFGHLGFRRTSIWIDPEKQLFVVLLTHRVNPSPERILQLRAALHDEVVKAVWLSAGPDLAADAAREVATQR